MKLILAYLRRHLGMFVAAVFFLTVEAASDLLQPTFMSFIVDKGVVAGDTGLILRYGAIMLAIALVGAVGAVMRNILATKTSQAIGRELRSDLFSKVQTFSFENIDRLQTGSIVTRITNDVTQIQNFIAGCMRMLVKSPLTCIGAVVLIIIQTPRQLPIMLAILAISGVLIAYNMKLGYPRYGILQQRLDHLNGTSREFLSSIRVVKAFCAEDQESERFSGAASELADASVSATRVQAVFSPLINLTVNMGIIALLWVSQSQSASEIGRLMASVNYMTQVLFALSRVSAILNTAVRGVASSNRVKEILDEKPALEEPKNPLPLAIKGGIAFESVSFSYEHASRSALADVSFSAAPGETIGIIGPTGSGKTTLVNLVPRFYDPTFGTVSIDGCDIRLLDSKAVSDAVAIVPQSPLLFTGSIESNLRWGDADATEKDLQAAAHVSQADEFIARLEDGYQTMLGQGGVNLSGGQKQRLCIARALVHKPKILILDDCTSALDATTEAAVLEGLATTAADMTVLLISQRIATVMRADRIVCMEDGRICGLGTHAELMRDCSTYRAIYDSQIGGGR